MRLTLTNWRYSILMLGYEITKLAYTENLMPGTSTERGEFFFSDSGVPKPRPCTALAWASLCSFGPIQGYITVVDDDFFHHQYGLTHGKFLLPFLPKILKDEETSQSLSRQSKAHHRDAQDRIVWGSIYIGDSESGDIVETLSNGQQIAKAWVERPPRQAVAWTQRQHEVPALYAEAGAGWQFGIIQNLSSIPVSLRDPMIELARNGILELKHGGVDAPKVRRLMIRFLKTAEARAWAKAYSDAMHLALDYDAVIQDRDKLIEEMRKKQMRVEHEKANPAAKKLARFDNSFMADFIKDIESQKKPAMENK